MNETSTPTASLAARARAAAADHEANPAEKVWRDPHWTARARHAARYLADLLGIDYQCIEISANTSPARRSTPWIALTVTDGEAGYAFTVPYNRPDRILALAPCPDCSQPVPTRLITHLADLGEMLTGQAETPPAPGAYRDLQGRSLFEVAPEFDCTEHDLACPHHLLNILLSPLHARGLRPEHSGSADDAGCGEPG